MSSVHIDWGSLGVVAGVSLAFGIGIVAVFSLGLIGLSAAEGRLEGEDEALARRVPRGPGALLAGVCFLACAAAVGYGVYLIVA